MSSNKPKYSKVPNLSQNVISRPLAPRFLAFSMFLITFTLPNIVYSYDFFFSSLHLPKWLVVFVPLAILSLAAMFRLFRLGTGTTKFQLDGFALIWLLLILFISLQPLWTTIRSPETFYREWFFFASLWLVYVLSSHLADSALLRALLWGALANAVCNVFFAEMQIRFMTQPMLLVAFTPGSYIGNTGQQNMFALWMAISGLGGISLFFSCSDYRNKPLICSLLLALLAVVFWGLVSSTSRSGILSLLTGFVVLSAFYIRKDGRRILPKVFLAGVLFAVIMTLNLSLHSERAKNIMYKIEDVVQRPLSIAHRDSIWATSWTMFSDRPWRGVGLGQFKWNYIDAQQRMLQRWPHLKFQYTHWAHNEFLQWMAESGIFGALLMFWLWIWWGVSAGRAFFKRTPLSPDAIWGSSLVALFFFNALWTRPFHRIENAIWLAMAFAVTNREILIPLIRTPSPEKFEKRGRLLAAVISLVSIIGLFFLADGVRGDRLLRLGEEAAVKGGDATAITDYYVRAFKSPMVRDIAEKQAGYFSVLLGKSTGNSALIADGLNTILRYFEKQPHVDELKFLLTWTPYLENQEFVEYVHSFVYRPSPDAEPEAPASAESE